ncbi:MAG: DUF932 domain-containing protein, partial [Gammaproteobacteria bacterium]|nr:DUF932 domain-containing protein [Gammaproteobacteria bacterium]
MAHEIDSTTGKAAVAFIGTPPWHGLGQEMPEGADIDQWRIAAGLDWEAKRSPVHYQNGELREWGAKNVIYRSDTNAPLSVVSSDYKILQPADALAFFRGMTETADITIETAGSLKEGRRIWALGRIDENREIMDDEVAPYLLLATSYDGTMATVAKFTSIRVVCNNTLHASINNEQGKAQVTVPHSTNFDAGEVRSMLGLDVASWNNFNYRANMMARNKLSDTEMDTFLQELLRPNTDTPDIDKIRRSKGYMRIMDLYKGEQIGGQMDAVNGTAWGALNAVT